MRQKSRQLVPLCREFRLLNNPCQLCEETGFGEGPRYLICDNDKQYGDSFDSVAAGIEVLKTPYQAPRANVP